MSLCLMVHNALGVEQDKENVNAVSSEQLSWRLERLNVDRIKNYAVRYQQQLKRSDVYYKALFFAGGALTSGGLIWLGSKFLGSHDAEQPQTVPVEIPPGPAITEQEYRRALLALKRELIDDNKQGLSFWGSVRQGVNDGAAVAFYSFVGSIVLASLSSSWKKSGRWINQLLGLVSVKDYVKEHEQLLTSVGRTLTDLVPEYEQSCERILTLGAPDPIATSFVTFLEREIVKQHAVFIQVIEESIAFLSEVQQRNIKDKNKELLQVFDDQIKMFWGVLDSYVDALEHMLNAPLDNNKTMLCKNVLLVSRQVYYQADHFIEECKNLAF